MAMRGKIGMIGSGTIGLAIANSLMKKNIDVVAIDDLQKEESVSLLSQDTNRYINYEASPLAKELFELNKDTFVCKGKHQYRHVSTVSTEYDGGVIKREVWECQCGLKLNQAKSIKY